MLLWVNLLAQASSAETELLQYGVLGVVVIVLGWFAQFMLRRLIKEIDELRGQRDTMIQAVLETVPLIKQSNAIHEMRQRSDVESREQLAEVTDVLRDVRRLLEARKL